VKNAFLVAVVKCVDELDENRFDEIVLEVETASGNRSEHLATGAESEDDEAVGIIADDVVHRNNVGVITNRLVQDRFAVVNSVLFRTAGRFEHDLDCIINLLGQLKGRDVESAINGAITAFAKNFQKLKAAIFDESAREFGDGRHNSSKDVRSKIKRE
jgi:hypothetical protein